MKSILITGALGHIGSAIIRGIQKNQFKKVILIDNFETQRYSSLFSLSKKNNIKFYDNSILDKNIENIAEFLRSNPKNLAPVIVTPALLAPGINARI